MPRRVRFRVARVSLQNTGEPGETRPIARIVKDTDGFDPTQRVRNRNRLISQALKLLMEWKYQRLTVGVKELAGGVLSEKQLLV
jgi:hypothetical protein